MALLIPGMGCLVSMKIRWNEGAFYPGKYSPFIYKGLQKYFAKNEF
jgi:hypothetical protein